MATTSPLVTPTRVVQSIPALPGLPFLGNILECRKDRLGLNDRAQRLGGIARLSMVHIPVYTITDADMAHQVFVTDADAFKKSAGLRFMEPLLGNGLLTSEIDVH